MLVLNACQSDARVLREASSLGRAGYDVRVFALADQDWPPGTVEVSGTTVVRLWAPSPFVQAARAVAGARARGSATASDETARPPRPGFGGATSRLLRRLLLPLHRPSVYLRFWRRAQAAVRAWEPDVVHAHDLPALPPAAAVARRAQVPLVYDTHELWRHRNRHGQLRPLGRAVDALVERRLVRHCDRVVTVSDSIAAWLQRRYRLRRPVVVLRNVPERRGTADAPSLRALAGLPGDAQVLLYTGRVLPFRGIEQAVAALPLLPPGLHLVLLGYGDRDVVQRVMDLAEQHGVPSRLHVVGPVRPDQVVGVAAEATVALVGIQATCLSHRFALPNKLFEAVAAGVPVVANDLPDVRRVVERYGVGVVADLADGPATATAVLEVLESVDRYSEAARTAALELCWEVEEQVLLDLYTGLSGRAA
jgi:glycosyltransferase involved in cell wall biosynthesis